jgi:hypothetical protein
VTIDPSPSWRDRHDHFESAKKMEKLWEDRVKSAEQEAARCRAQHTKWARESCRAFHALQNIDGGAK